MLEVGMYIFVDVQSQIRLDQSQIRLDQYQVGLEVTSKKKLIIADEIIFLIK
jgi:hypothetical protein